MLGYTTVSSTTFYYLLSALVDTVLLRDAWSAVRDRGPLHARLALSASVYEIHRSVFMEAPMCLQ